MDFVGILKIKHLIGFSRNESENLLRFEKKLTYAKRKIVNDRYIIFSSLIFCSEFKILAYFI